MSEYLSKKAALEWFDERKNKSMWLESLRERIQSGAFDAPEMEHINAYWAREGLIKHQEAEVQRLRAALEQARAIMEDALSVGEATYEDFDIKFNPWADLSMGVEEINKTLSQSPTEQSAAERDITEVYVVRNRYKDILYVGLEWNEVEGLLAQDASYEYLSYGINAPEKEGRT